MQAGKGSGGWFLRAVSFEADHAAQVLPDPGVVVRPIIAIHGAQVPWGKVLLDGIPVVPAKHLPSMLRALPALPRLPGWDQAGVMRPHI
jgi:hypothetical protein